MLFARNAFMALMISQIISIACLGEVPIHDEDIIKYFHNKYSVKISVSKIDNKLTVMEEGHTIINDIDSFFKDLSSKNIVDRVILIQLQKQGLEKIPEKIRYFKNLRHLKLENNCIRTIPSWLSHLKKLIVLNLDDNSISKLPSFFYDNNKVPNLRYLTLNDNKGITPEEKTEIDTMMKKRRSKPSNEALDETFIGAYHVSIIPDPLESNDLFVAVQRGTFALGGKGIVLGRGMKRFFKSLLQYSPRIVGISLIDQKLKEIPEEISDFTNLRYLYLESNHIRTIPDWLSRLKKLIVLNLEDNEISKLPSFFYKKSEVPSLRYLSLNDNKGITQEEKEKINAMMEERRSRIPESDEDLINEFALTYGVTIEADLLEPNELHVIAKNGTFISGRGRGLGIEHFFKRLAQYRTRIVAISLIDEGLTQLPSKIEQFNNLKWLILKGNNNIASLPKSLLSLELLQIDNMTYDTENFGKTQYFKH